MSLVGRDSREIAKDGCSFSLLEQLLKERRPVADFARPQATKATAVRYIAEQHDGNDNTHLRFLWMSMLEKRGSPELNREAREPADAPDDVVNPF